MAKILIVEDEPDLRETIVEELNDQGHLTIEAGNGLEGLERLAVEKPDMILSDITMPKMNGYQFFRSLRERHPEHAETPFLFLSALSDRDHELKGLRLGADDYLTKPIDFDLMTVRIDLALRHRPTTTSSPPPEKPISEEQTSSVEAGEIIQAHDGHVLAATFETISLEAIRAKFGERCSELSKRILETTEATIRQHLGPKDALQLTNAQKFLLCFADLTEDQMQSRVDAIRDAVGKALFEQTNDEDLSEVQAQAHKLPLDIDEDGNAQTTLSEISDRVDEQKTAANQSDEKRLQQIHQYEDLHALPLLAPAGQPSKIKLLSMEKQYGDLVRDLFSTRHYEESFLVELSKTFTERLMETGSIKNAFKQSAMLLPIRFEVIGRQEVRDEVIAYYQDLERHLDLTLITEIIGTPNDIKSQMAFLKPIPVGRQLQFLELDWIEQLNDLEPSALRKLGVAFVSMRFAQVKKHDEKKFVQFVKDLEEASVKVFIKDIPEGSFAEAQARNAHLYAMQR